VTGGGSGIGFATARAFAIAGAKAIIIVARRVETLKEKAAQLAAELPSTKVLTFPLDISNEDAVNKVFAEVRDRLSADIDVVVLSAATMMIGVPAMQYSTKQLYDAFGTNVIGNINVVRAFLSTIDPKSPESKTRKIILDISTHSSYERYPMQAMYGASKLAFTHFVRHIGAEYARTGLRIHSYHPGGILTDATRVGGLDEDSYAWDDVSLPAGLATWLASPAAAFLNGRFILSNWDVDELAALKDTFEADEDFGRIVLKIKPKP
jgi:NAD(P)-dependent dehydrogenase (short-subunit alcohol dehydrogenase family)